jgi:predicted ribosomally synthesized peptide with SipW-like signal peptide
VRRAAGMAIVVVLAAGIVAVAHAYFTASKTSPQTIQAVSDFLPPTIGSAAVYAGGAPGVIASSGYQVYAQVADQGNPPSGVKRVTADVSSLGGPTALTLTPGAYPPGQSLYNYGSATQTASGSLVSGTTKLYNVTATDNLDQAATGSFSVTVGGGGSACRATGITAPNGGAKVRTVDAGDRITFSFSTSVDQQSIVPGWSGGGSPGPMTVKVSDAGSSDTITVWNGSTQTPLGTIQTGGNYVASGTVDFSGTLIKSGNDIILTIDTSPSAATTTPGPTTMTWTPASGITYDNGKPCATTPATQPSAVDNF